MSAPVIAHVSDLHVDGGARSMSRAGQVFDYLAGLCRLPDAVVVTGDITATGTRGEYDCVRELIAPLRARLLVLLCPGNHDVRDAFRATLLPEAPPVDAPLDQRHRIAGVTLLLCDSTAPGRSEGRLSAATLAWLDRELTAAAGTRVLVVLHHPPVEVGIPAMDRLRLREPERLAAVLRDHENVVAVLCGHVHAATSTRFAGLPLLVAPGVHSSALLPLERPDGDPMTGDLPVGLAFHTVADDGLTTHFRALPS